MPDQEPSFEVNGKRYSLPTDLTTGEMCDAEQHFGVEFGNKKSSGIRMAAALLWVAISRVDVTVTPEDIRALPGEVFETIGTGDAGPPSADASSPKPDGSSGTSGTVGSSGGENQDNGQSLTGDPGSAIGADSDPVTSAA